MLKTATQVSIFLSLSFCFASTFLHIVLSCSLFMCQARFRYTCPHFTCNCYFNTNTFFNFLCFLGVKAEEWGTFLHCKNQVHLSEGFTPCASCICLVLCALHDSPVCHFDRSSQIFWKYIGKLKERLNAALETTR